MTQFRMVRRWVAILIKRTSNRPPCSSQKNHPCLCQLLWITKRLWIIRAWKDSVKGSPYWTETDFWVTVWVFQSRHSSKMTSKTTVRIAEIAITPINIVCKAWQTCLTIRRLVLTSHADDWGAHMKIATLVTQSKICTRKIDSKGSKSW